MRAPTAAATATPATMPWMINDFELLEESYEDEEDDEEEDEGEEQIAMARKVFKERRGQWQSGQYFQICLFMLK